MAAQDNYPDIWVTADDGTRKPLSDWVELTRKTADGTLPVTPSGSSVSRALNEWIGNIDSTLADPISALLAPLTNNVSATLTILADSLSNDPTDWEFRILTERFGPALSDVCIRRCQWDDASQRYGAWSTLQNGASGPRYARFSESLQSTRIVTPDGVYTKSSPDLEFEIKVSLDDWTPSAQRRLCGKLGAAGNRSWYLQVATTGALQFYWSTDGTATVNVTSSVPGFVDGQAYTIRVKLDVDNGGGGYTTSIEYSANDGASWTSIHSAATSAGTTSIFTSTANYEVGSASGAGYYDGNVYDFAVRDGIGGPTITPTPIEAWWSSDQAKSLVNTLGGSPTLYVYNASVSGMGLDYFMDATRLPKTAVPASVQLTILATCGNDAAHNWRKLATSWTTWTTSLKDRMPTSGFLILNGAGRNMNVSDGKSFGEMSIQRAHVLAMLGQRLNIPTLDTIRAMARAVNNGTSIDALIPDGKHPSDPVGTNVLIDEIWRPFAERIARF